MPLSYRIDARDKENPLYYLDGREVPKREFYSVLWRGSRFAPKWSAECVPPDTNGGS